MKKFFIVLTALLVGFSAFAEKDDKDFILCFGLTLPQTYGDINDCKFVSHGVAADIQIMSVQSSRLIIGADIDIGGASASIDYSTDYYNIKTETAFALSSAIRIGGAVVKKEKFTLGLGGTAGCSIELFNYKYKPNDYAIITVGNILNSGKKYTSSDVNNIKALMSTKDCFGGYFLFNLGAFVFANFRLGEHFGLFADIKTTYGWGEFIETGDINGSTFALGFQLKPSLGASITF